MNLSRRDQLLLVLLVVILAGFALYRLAYLPVSKEMAAIAASNQQLHMDEERLQAEAKKVPAPKEQPADKFAHLNRRLPSEDEMIPLLTMLDETTVKHNLPFASLDYRGAEKTDESGAQTLVFTLGTKGKITQLFNFLHELENAERLISVEDVSFSGVKAENQQTTAAEPAAPTYYIAPPGIPEAKLQRIQLEVVEEKETPADSETPVAYTFQPEMFEMKLTIKAYYAVQDKAVKAEKADNERESANDARGEV